ncbi:hypothetical protein MHEL_39520 [Mycolicibacterium helvum]|uniref:Uncharacterized protein n=1 Tax=Mycolicibacterium helvum TaxID=1534349 RepID=A0A7I7TB83_9MYCO|nr:hypothetical protein MHEL_39520 [Mycolicibacterium helvum]
MPFKPPGCVPGKPSPSRTEGGTLPPHRLGPVEPIEPIIQRLRYFRRIALQIQHVAGVRDDFEFEVGTDPDGSPLDRAPRGKC